MAVTTCSARPGTQRTRRASSQEDGPACRTRAGVDFRAGRGVTGERGEATRAVPGRRWEAGQGPRLAARSGCGGAPAWRTEPHSGVLQPQQDAVLGAGRAAAPAGCIAAQTASASAASRGQPWMEGPRPQPASAPRAWHGLPGPAFVPGCGPREHQRGHGAQSGRGLQDGGRPEWAAWDPRACFPPRWRLPRDTGEWQQPLQRKSLKKRRLRELTAHSAPLLPRPWVGSGPAWRLLITGRGGGAGGRVLGTVLAPGFPKAKALRLFLKTRGSHSEAKGPC